MLVYPNLLQSSANAAHMDGAIPELEKLAHEKLITHAHLLLTVCQVSHRDRCLDPSYSANYINDLITLTLCAQVCPDVHSQMDADDKRYLPPCFNERTSCLQTTDNGTVYGPLQTPTSLIITPLHICATKKDPQMGHSHGDNTAPPSYPELSWNTHGGVLCLS